MVIKTAILRRGLAATFFALWMLGYLSCAGEIENPTTPLVTPQPRPGVDGKKAYKLLEEIVATGPRIPGSRASAKTRKILKDRLKNMGLRARSQLFKKPIRGLETTMVNLWVDIPGKARDRMILIGTHYDTKITSGHPDPDHNFKFDGANDSGSGTVLLIEIARKLLERSDRAITYRLVWFDGEESIAFDWDDDHALHGSRYCAANWNLAQVEAMILVDIIGAPKLILDDDTNSSARLKKLFTRASIELGFHQPFFNGPTYPVIDDHIPFKEKGVEVLNLIGLNQLTQLNIWHTPRDTIDRVSPTSLANIGDVLLQALKTMEKD